MASGTYSAQVSPWGIVIVVQGTSPRNTYTVAFVGSYPECLLWKSRNESALRAKAQAQKKSKKNPSVKGREFKLMGPDAPFVQVLYGGRRVEIQPLRWMYLPQSRTGGTQAVLVANIRGMDGQKSLYLDKLSWPEEPATLLVVYEEVPESYPDEEDLAEVLEAAWPDATLEWLSPTESSIAKQQFLLHADGSYRIYYASIALLKDGDTQVLHLKPEHLKSPLALRTALKRQRPGLSQEIWGYILANARKAVSQPHVFKYYTRREGFNRDKATVLSERAAQSLAASILDDLLGHSVLPGAHKEAQPPKLSPEVRLDVQAGRLSPAVKAAIQERLTWATPRRDVANLEEAVWSPARVQGQDPRAVMEVEFAERIEAAEAPGLYALEESPEQEHKRPTDVIRALWLLRYSDEPTPGYPETLAGWESALGLVPGAIEKALPSDLPALYAAWERREAGQDVDALKAGVQSLLMKLAERYLQTQRG